MKTLILAATFASLALSVAAPLQAATAAPGAKSVVVNTEIDRRGRGCDTAHDIAQHPRCTR